MPCPPSLSDPFCSTLIWESFASCGCGWKGKRVHSSVLLGRAEMQEEKEKCRRRRRRRRRRGNVTRLHCIVICCFAGQYCTALFNGICSMTPTSTHWSIHCFITISVQCKIQSTFCTAILLTPMHCKLQCTERSWTAELRRMHFPGWRNLGPVSQSVSQADTSWVEWRMDQRHTSWQWWRNQLYISKSFPGFINPPTLSFPLPQRCGFCKNLTSSSMTPSIYLFPTNSQNSSDTLFKYKHLKFFQSIFFQMTQYLSTLYYSK